MPTDGPAKHSVIASYRPTAEILDSPAAQVLVDYNNTITGNEDYTFTSNNNSK